MIIAYQLFCVCDQIEGPNSCVYLRIIPLKKKVCLENTSQICIKVIITQFPK